jgi:Tol biopolymer transport system component
VDLRMTALSGDGRWLAGVRPTRGASTDVVLYDRKEGKMADVAGLNSPRLDVEPCLSSAGRLIAFTSDRPGGKGGRDVYLYDRKVGKLLPLPGLNSKAEDFDPKVVVPGGKE